MLFVSCLLILKTDTESSFYSQASHHFKQGNKKKFKILIYLCLKRSSAARFTTRHRRSTFETHNPFLQGS